ncbi:winged helix-turn-helix domain-containing protein [Pedobacter sp. KR3-3]|uniref:Winged helix-turn-helix domain-containing protein n=1 Tax=Pedobacter albus TaxID=3113905 RepID=A0ABU7I9D1_9SPHI|nr:winged helix-turn-helix domain-containing protein [Pedobacter sp. KR3-3]MEE1945819.1 winged helix-turn-helix domain-containing protein [Pedobacter sp. KR3-3]
MANTSNKYILGLLALLLTTVICMAFSLGKNDDFDLAKQEILLRKIGHEVLLHAGDNTSRVLPVKKIAYNEYELRFEDEFAFQPDSLIKIISRTLAKDELATNYMVNVRSCVAREVIFGYMVSKNQSNNIVPCTGRVQPKGCYLIDIKFESPMISAAQKNYLIGGLPMFAFIGLLLFRAAKTRNRQKDVQITGENHFKLGNTLFDAQKRQLVLGETQTELTFKENKLLAIFASAPNTIIARSRLQKEIWEDEGVIVGRSLDVFISKLRKKLEDDPGVSLVNIHGKGYKLEIIEPNSSIL